MYTVRRSKEFILNVKTRHRCALAAVLAAEQRQVFLVSHALSCDSSWIGTESPKSRIVAAWTNVRLARSAGYLFARKVAHACKIVSSTTAKIDGAISSAQATTCTRTSNTLRNTLSKKLALRPSARLWRELRTTQTPSFAKRRTFRVLCLQ